MKIGLSTYSLAQALQKGEMTFLDIIQWIADNGGEHFEVVNFLGDFLGDGDLVKAVVEKSQALNLPVSAYCTAMNALSKDNLDTEFERAFKSVDLTNRLGAKVMRCDLVAWDIPRDQMTIDNFDRDLPALVEAARRLADYAKQYDITITVENHGMYVNGGERVRRLITAVDRENYGCTLDVGNTMCVDENSLVCLDTLLPYAKAIHFKDFYVRRDAEAIGEGFFIESPRGCRLRGAIVGHGDANVRLIMEAIKKAGYDGWIAIEFEGMEDCRVGSKIGMDNVRRLASL